MQCPNVKTNYGNALENLMVSSCFSNWKLVRAGSAQLECYYMLSYLTWWMNVIPGLV